MRNGRPKALLELTAAEAAQLQSFARSRSLPGSLRERARIVLASAEGESNTAIAASLKLSKATVGKWRASFLTRRLAGLYDNAPSSRQTASLPSSTPLDPHDGRAVTAVDTCSASPWSPLSA